MSKPNNFLPGIIFAFTNCISLGILGIIDKIGSSHTSNPFIFSTQSVLFGLIFVTIFACVYFKGTFVEKLKKTPPSLWKLIFLVGIFAAGIFTIFRFIGLTQSTGTFATLAQVIITSVTAILALIFLKEKLSKNFWVFFIAILIATYFVSVGKFTLTSLHYGDSYILAGTLFVAVANIFAKLVVNKTSPVILSFGRFLFGGLFLLLVSLFFFNGSSSLLHITIWSALSGLFWTINTITFNFAIQRIGVTLTTSILMIAPVIAMTLEFILLQHIFTAIQVVAAFVVIISGLLMVATKNKIT